MKKNKYIVALISAALLQTVTSCTVFQSSGATSKFKGENNIEVPQDRTPVVPVRPSATYTPEELKKGIIKGDWAIEQVDGKPVVAESAPYIRFEPSLNRIYGNNGCNTINGEYKYSAKNHTISFSNLITTLMACGTPGISDMAINAALNATTTYAVQEKENEYWLYFQNADGETVLSLMHQNFDFLNGTWLVQSIKDKNINVKGQMLVPDMKMVIDVPEGKIHGHTGCNILNGDFDTDMERPNSISFQNIATTRMACPPQNNFETDLLVALEEVTTAHPVDAATVELLNSQKQVIIVLVRTSDKTPG